MPTNAEMIRLLGKIGSDRRTVKTTLLTHLRHQPSGTPARRMPSQMRFSAARKAELSLIEEAAASEVGIEKSNGYALQCGWVDAYDCASRPAFDRLQPVLGRASDAGLHQS